MKSETKKIVTRFEVKNVYRIQQIKLESEKNMKKQQNDKWCFH